MKKMVYLVAIPNGMLKHCANKIQQSIWEKYDLGIDEFPEIHITIDAFYYENEEELEKITYALEDIVSKIKAFEVSVDGFGYIPNPHNCITLHVVKTEELKKVYFQIHNNMKKKGFDVRDFSPEEIVFHISVAGMHGRIWSESESLSAWEDIRHFKFREISLLQEFQLWHPDLNSDDKVITKIKLNQ